MGTAFFLHDDYPGFNSPAFTPALPATGMVEVVGAAGHAVTLLFHASIVDPVLRLGSLASTLSFPSDTPVTRLSGSTLGPSDSFGSVLLTGVFDALAFTLTPTFGDSTSQDGVFLQVGGSRPS